jgi:ABC-type dipeptide/oligopeptide/nickel transport system permease component
MGTYIARRLLFMIPTLIGITFLVFMIVALAPGGIGAALQVAAGGTLQASSGAAVQQAYLEDRYGLDDPVAVQYLRWLRRISPVKLGERDQVLPNGEFIRPPKPLKAPMVWNWYADALPVPPPQSPPDIAALSIEARDRLWRSTERQTAEARFELLGATTRLKSALVDYIRAAGIPHALTSDLKPRPSVLHRHTPNRSIPQFAKVREAGVEAIAAYERAQTGRAKLTALFRQLPFQRAGMPVIPGTLSLAAPDLGTAFSKSRPSLDIIMEHLPVTLLLNLLAIPIIYSVAIPSGILAATRKGSVFDVGIGTLYIGFYSFPVVLAGVLAVGFLASRDYANAFPVAGLHSLDAPRFTFLPSRDEGGNLQAGYVLDMLWHMFLPVLCLTYTGFAVLSKQTRAAMLENFNADYVRTAKAKGVAPRDVVFRHVFRNSLLPVITIFVTIFPAMLAGSVVVERIFSVRGMGWLVLEAVTLRDRELILANTVIVAAVNLLALLLADLLYALADPRISYE